MYPFVSVFLFQFPPIEFIPRPPLVREPLASRPHRQRHRRGLRGASGPRGRIQRRRIRGTGEGDRGGGQRRPRSHPDSFRVVFLGYDYWDYFLTNMISFPPKCTKSCFWPPPRVHAKVIFRKIKLESCFLIITVVPLCETSWEALRERTFRLLDVFSFVLELC